MLKEIINELEILRVLRLKLTKQRSPLNHEKYKKQLRRTVEIIKKEEDKWVIKECKKLTELPGKAKWKVIERVTNQTKQKDIYNQSGM